MAHEILNEEIIFHGKVFDLAKVRFRLPNGKEPVFDLVKHHGAVTIVPVDTQGRIWFVRQYRVGAQQSLLEIPAGLLETDESPELSANRELQEEIGMFAGKLQKLGEFYMVPGYSTEKMYAFLASEMHAAELPTDEDELIERVALPVQQVYEMVRSGEFMDGKTLASLLLAQPYLSQMGF